MNQFPEPMLDWLREQGEDKLAAALMSPAARYALTQFIITCQDTVPVGLVDLECDCHTEPHYVGCIPNIIHCAIDPDRLAKEVALAWTAALKSEKQRREYREKKAAGTLPKRKRSQWPRRRRLSVTGTEW